MAYRELSVVEVKEILRRWSRGESLRTVAAWVGADRKTVRRHVAVAMRHGLVRGGLVDDELLAQVVADVFPGAPVQVGVMRQLCREHKSLIEGWVKAGCKSPKVKRLLHRHIGVEVPERTLRRFILEELGEAKHVGATVRIVDPPPGQILEIDFMEVGRVFVDGEFRKLCALICVASFSRHLFVWPCLTGVDPAQWTLFYYRRRMSHGNTPSTLRARVQGADDRVGALRSKSGVAREGISTVREDHP